MDAINKMRLQYPKFNWVICHSPYSANFDGVEGTDWDYTHHTLLISFGREIGSVSLLTFLFCISFFLITFKTDTIFIGQNLEYSIDMETVDLLTYVLNGSSAFELVT